MLPEPAHDAQEHSLALSIGLVRVAAVRASPTRVPRIDQHARNPRKLSLVRDERPDLKERPACVLCSLRVPDRYPISDAREIFKGDAASGVFGLLHDTLADAVVLDTPESGLLTRNLFEPSFGTSSASRLKSLTMICVPLADRFHLGSRMELSVRIHSEICNPEVYAEPIENLGLFSVRNVYSHEEEELALAEDKISLPSLEAEKLSLLLPANERDPLSSLDGPDVGRVVLPREDAGVVSNGAEGFERSSYFLIQSVGVSDFSHASDDHLRGQGGKSVSGLSIEKLLEIVLPKCLGLESLGSEPVARSVCHTKRARQKSFLCLCRQELDLDDELHTVRVARSIIERKKRRTLPPRPEGRGFRAEIR